MNIKKIWPGIREIVNIQNNISPFTLYSATKSAPIKINKIYVELLDSGSNQSNFNQILFSIQPI